MQDVKRASQRAEKLRCTADPSRGASENERLQAMQLLDRLVAEFGADVLESDPVIRQEVVCASAHEADFVQALAHRTGCVVFSWVQGSGVRRRDRKRFVDGKRSVVRAVVAFHEMFKPTLDRLLRSYAVGFACGVVPRHLVVEPPESSVPAKQAPAKGIDQVVAASAAVRGMQERDDASRMLPAPGGAS